MDRRSLSQAHSCAQEAAPVGPTGAGLALSARGPHPGGSPGSAGPEDCAGTDTADRLRDGASSASNALLSPSHLVLFTGGLLVLSSAVRSRWGAGDIASPVAVGAVALVTALVSFFLLYVSDFTANASSFHYW